VFIAVYQ